eukprot:jgi/Mesvir1/26105/Mv06824-RA.1
MNTRSGGTSNTPPSRDELPRTKGAKEVVKYFRSMMRFDPFEDYATWREFEDMLLTGCEAYNVKDVIDGTADMNDPDVISAEKTLLTPIISLMKGRGARVARLVTDRRASSVFKALQAECAARHLTADIACFVTCALCAT